MLNMKHNKIQQQAPIGTRSADVDAVLIQRFEICIHTTQNNNRPPLVRSADVGAILIQKFEIYLKYTCIQQHTTTGPDRYKKC